MRSRLLSLSVAALLSSLLAACGGGPNDDDLHAALTQSINHTQDQQEKALKSFMGDSPQAQSMLDQQRQDALGIVAKTHVVGCKSADAGGYRCDVSYNGQVKNIRLIKDNGAWSIVEE